MALNRRGHHRFESTSLAEYNANLTGIVAKVLTYDTDARIYIVLENQPPTHPVCDRAYFAIDSAVPAAAREQMYARLLTAFATQQPLNIGYDNAGNCAHGKIRVHRVG